MGERSRKQTPKVAVFDPADTRASQTFPNGQSRRNQFNQIALTSSVVPSTSTHTSSSVALDVLGGLLRIGYAIQHDTTNDSTPAPGQRQTGPMPRRNANPDLHPAPHLHPHFAFARPRQTSTTASLTSADSWSMPAPSSSRTSVWSDDATATILPPTPGTGMDPDWKGMGMGVGMEMGVAVGMEDISTIVDHGDGEEPLIDFESEGDGPTRRAETIVEKRRVGEGMSPTSAMTPGDKLRELLHMMETEVREAKPAKAEAQVRGPSPVRRDPARRAEERHAAWRLRRSALARDERDERDGPRSEGEASGSDVQEHDQSEGEAEHPGGAHSANDGLSPRRAATDESEESPPSPPMRISNPYRHARMSLERRTPTPPNRSVQSAGEGLAGELHPPRRAIHR